MVSPGSQSENLGAHRGLYSNSCLQIPSTLPAEDWEIRWYRSRFGKAEDAPLRSHPVVMVPKRCSNKWTNCGQPEASLPALVISASLPEICLVKLLISQYPHDPKSAGLRTTEFGCVCDRQNCQWHWTKECFIGIQEPIMFPIESLRDLHSSELNAYHWIKGSCRNGRVKLDADSARSLEDKLQKRLLKARTTACSSMAHALQLSILNWQNKYSILQESSA